MIRMLWAHVRWLAAVARWCVETVGYWVRPYDMLADARRWRWQPRHRCGWSQFARGGVIRGPADRSDDSVPFMLSRCRPVTDPDEVEAFGLTVEARRMRERLRGERS